MDNRVKTAVLVMSWVHHTGRRACGVTLLGGAWCRTGVGMGHIQGITGHNQAWTSNDGYPGITRPGSNNTAWSINKALVHQ